MTKHIEYKEIKISRFKLVSTDDFSTTTKVNKVKDDKKNSLNEEFDSFFDDDDDFPTATKVNKVKDNKKNPQMKNLTAFLTTMTTIFPRRQR